MSVKIRSIILMLLVFLISELDAYAGKDNYVKIGTGYYVDNGGVLVGSPFIDGSMVLNEKLNVDIGLRVDVITAASIRNGGRPDTVDVVTGASKKSGPDDLRWAPNLSVNYDFLNNSLSIGGYYSKEKDYDGRSIFLSFLQYLNHKNTTLNLGISVSRDLWSPNIKREGFPKSRDEDRFSLTLSQILSRRSHARLTVDWSMQRGFLSSPYHYIIKKDFALFERIPERRNSISTTAEVIWLLAKPLSLHLSARYFKDSWHIESITTTGSLIIEPFEKFLFLIGLRYYNQDSAFFVKSTPDDYMRDDEYVVSDYRYSAFSSKDLLFSVLYEIKGGFLFEKKTELELSIEYYRTSKNNYIKSWYNKDFINALFGAGSISLYF